MTARERSSHSTYVVPIRPIGQFMASKNQRSSKKTARSTSNTSEDLTQRVERLLDESRGRSRSKEAIKLVKTAMRQNGASASLRQLLQRGYFCRIRELIDLGMTPSARDVAQSLLSSGPIDDRQIRQGLSVLLPQLGLLNDALALDLESNGDQAIDPETRRRDLERRVLDEAILNPAMAPQDHPELVVQAARIRDCIDALSERTSPSTDKTSAETSNGPEQTGSDTILSQLDDVSRRSPLADWRLFVRGLAAYYQGAIESAQHNWSRLDPERPASRIARRLLVLDEPFSPSAMPLPKPTLEALDDAVFGRPALTTIQSLAEALDQKQYDAALSQLVSSRTELSRISPRLLQSVTRALYDALVREADEAEDDPRLRAVFTRFTRVTMPLAIDPRWNRFRALVYEADLDQSLEAITEAWKAYLADLDQFPVVPPRDHALARAMIHRHIASIYISDVHHFKTLVEGSDPSSNTDQEMFYLRQSYREAIQSLEASMEACPDYDAAYQLRLSLASEFRDTNFGLKVAKRWVDRKPESLMALNYLGYTHLKMGQPEEALPYAIAARQLKPLDRTYAERVWLILSEIARSHIKAGRWEQAAASLDQAEQQVPRPPRPSATLVRRAILALLSQPEQADTLIDQALQVGTSPTTVWLDLAIECYEHNLKAPARTYDQNYRQAVDQESDPNALGEAALTLLGLVRSGRTFRGLQTVVKRLIDRIKERFQQSEPFRASYDALLAISQLGAAAQAPQSFRLKLLELGCSEFPDRIYFLYHRAKLESEVGRGSITPFRIMMRISELEPKLVSPAYPEDTLIASEAQAWITEYRRQHRRHFSDSRISDLFSQGKTPTGEEPDPEDLEELADLIEAAMNSGALEDEDLSLDDRDSREDSGGPTPASQPQSQGKTKGKGKGKSKAKSNTKSKSKSRKSR